MTAAKPASSRPSRAPSRRKAALVAPDDAKVASWAKQFDAKLAKLTERQEAFLTALEAQATHRD